VIGSWKNAHPYYFALGAFTYIDPCKHRDL